jgi:prepilin-type N-terminal cleavage/methylation domain-containing protein
MNRNGFTLVELLVASVVMGILALALIGMLRGDSRFAAQQNAMVSARRTARGALNVMTPELRLVSDGGLVAASPDSVRVRVPYGFGMVCRTNPSDSHQHISQLPADSAMYAAATASGVAWRSDAGTYTFVSGISTSKATQLLCVQDSIRIVPGGREIYLTPPLPVAIGTIVYLYQTVTYRFAPSTTLPGRRALWRQAGTAAAQEMVSPFDASAQFRCLTGTGLLAVTCPPAGGLSTVRGIQVRLVGASEYAPEGRSAPETYDLTTDIPFVNGLQP